MPLSDRGIDALVHRFSDGKYIPIQAKGRSSLTDGEVHIVVWADSLKDDDALLVSGQTTEGGLGPTILVIPEGDFKRLAELSHNGDRPIYSARFGMHPRERSRFYPFWASTVAIASSPAASLPGSSITASKTTARAPSCFRCSKTRAHTLRE